MYSRRTFLKGTAAAGIAFGATRFLGLARARAAALGSGLSDPSLQPKFAEPVINALDPSFILQSRTDGPETYRIRAGKATQETGLIDPATGGRLKTDIWGYGDETVSWPGATVQVQSSVDGSSGPDETVIRWVNDIPDKKHLLPVDPTLHWAYGLHGHISANGVDYRQYSIEKDGVPIVVHLHGGHTQSRYDGNPEFFFNPGATVTGPQWDEHGGFTDLFRYDNGVPAGNLWYHDHALGITRLNVCTGLAGLYFIRDRFDSGQQDNPLGLPAFPYELAYAVQDRMFTDTGALFFPAFPGDPFYSDNITDNGVTLPPDLFPGGGPTAFPEFFGDHMLVNGSIWPVAAVEPRHYRLRLLNGCDSRTVVLRFRPVAAGATDLSSAGAPLPFYVIGSDQGLASSASQTDRLVFEGGGRYDLVFDFSQVPAGSRVIVENVAPDSPFHGDIFADLSADEVAALVEAGRFFPDRQTNRIMAFDIVRPLDGSVPDRFDPSAIAFGFKVSTPTAPVRKVGLFEGKDEFGRTQPLLGTVADDLSSATPLTWSEPTTETPALDAIEDWEIYNFTVGAHPIHLHLINFQAQGRRELGYDQNENDPVQVHQHSGASGTAPRIENIEIGADVVLGPSDGYVENAPKDMVVALPKQVTTIRTSPFDRPGRYVWHCHLLSHEDHEMMRLLHVGPE